MSPEVPMFRRGRTSRLPQHQTRWPPQSFVAPFSWLLARDVEPGPGRAQLLHLGRR